MTSVLISRKRTTIALLLCAVILIIFIWAWRADNRNWRDLYVMKLVRTTLLVEELAPVKRSKNPGLVLDTPGCRIPRLDPFDASVIKLYEAKDPYPCPGPPLFMTSKPDGSIRLNETVLSIHYQLKPRDISCTYQSIRRVYEKPGNVRENDYEMYGPKPLKFGVPIGEDYVKVTCNLKGKKTFRQYFPLVRVKEEVEEKKPQLDPSTPHLNIIFAGIDSISKLNYLRHFPRTQAFIKEKGTFFEMNGYTKVGDNTFPNLNPLLTGRFPQDIWNETVKDTMYFDDVDIIWKRFAKKGYRTLYAEDSPFFGTYNYGRRGFNETPADYYLRPLYLVLHDSEVRKTGPWYCFNSQLEPDLIYDYLRDFVGAMEHRPYFAFAMISSITHDYLNNAGYVDYTTVKILEDLWEAGVDNSTMLVLFGDHGLRFGPIRETYLGKFEERMPFMYIHFPPWFLEQNPAFGKNMKDNQDRLMTMFDVHATMMHLLDPTQELTVKQKIETTPYGLSLLGEISPYRTCEKASIYTHWCCCQVIQEVSVLDHEVQKSSSVVKDCINNELRMQGSTCPALEVQKIVSAKLGQLNDLVLRFVKHENIVIDRNVVYGNRIVKYEDFLITMVTEPDDMVLEATVRHDVVEDVYCVVDIYELSSTGRLAKCVDLPKLELFRYCNA